jgi:mRNA-degrading endonuclease HigB of HigAB toxin-antitoxin module
MPKTNDFKVFESKKIQEFKQKPNSPKITFDRGKKNFRFNNKCSIKELHKHKFYLINHVSYETTGRMIPSRTNTPPAEESTR